MSAIATQTLFSRCANGLTRHAADMTRIMNRHFKKIMAASAVSGGIGGALASHAVNPNPFVAIAQGGLGAAVGAMSTAITAIATLMTAAGNGYLSARSLHYQAPSRLARVTAFVVPAAAGFILSGAVSYISTPPHAPANHNDNSALTQPTPPQPRPAAAAIYRPSSAPR
ncbi:MAG: hypothetical protein WDO70_11160 [Alphaproteobacteria bacterium]